MKFLVMLRDPVDRIDSDYNFNVSRNIRANKICQNKIAKEGNLYSLEQIFYVSKFISLHTFKLRACENY